MAAWPNGYEPVTVQMAASASKSLPHLILFLHIHIGDYRRETHMRFKKKELLFGVLLGTGLHLLESLRERLPDNVDDIKRRVRDTYDTASHRVSRATDALRGEEDSHTLGKVGAR
jgi:hypothetical protein